MVVEDHQNHHLQLLQVYNALSDFVFRLLLFGVL
jgi:hypothetical protein